MAVPSSVGDVKYRGPLGRILHSNRCHPLKIKVFFYVPVTRIVWKEYTVVVCKILSCIRVFLLQLDINQILKGKMLLNWRKGFTVKLL